MPRAFGKKNSDSPPSPSRTDTHRLHTQLNQKLCFYMLKFWRRELDYAILPTFLSLFTKLVGPLRVKGKINRELVWYLAVEYLS